MSNTINETVSWLIIDETSAGQRIDNFLLKTLKGVPKSHIYRILRSGEVRVNSRRIDATYRIATGDKLRVPPIRVAAEHTPRVVPKQRRLSPHVLYEDDVLLILDKPAGVAVHGGSGISLGAIEQLRLERPELKFLELVHRLDRDTSGVLLLAKKRSALVRLHELIRNNEIKKIYLTLATGRWRDALRHVRLPLHKFTTKSGERRVMVNPEGQASHTIFRKREGFAGYTLLEAELVTGRTHQIRVHLAHLGHPIAGDDKYNSDAANRGAAAAGLKRMFLHAYQVEFIHPVTEAPLRIEAPLPPALAGFLDVLRQSAAVAETKG